jgi:septal ring factor EnvC (AmiA/AmiB activator)
MTRTDKTSDQAARAVSALVKENAELRAVIERFDRANAAFAEENAELKAAIEKWRAAYKRQERDLCLALSTLACSIAHTSTAIASATLLLGREDVRP